jgi:nucleoside-diphosphate-sugar epimerase
MQALGAPPALGRALRLCPARARAPRRAQPAHPASARAAAAAAAAAGGLPAPRGRLLLLGGTGFVGTAVAEKALAAGWSVTSVSRRGRPVVDADGWPPRRVVDDVDWRAGDATDPAVVRAILEEGGFSAVMHCIGMLLNNDWNRFASGSGSVPTPGSTYDAVTRQTCLAAAADAAALCAKGPGDAPPPFVFVSAAEAAWTFEAPVEFLRNYLAAKRAVERELLDGYGDAGMLRPVVLRPSLVFTPRRPLALPAVAAFWAANAAGVPFVDRPVSVDTLAAAAVAALGDASVSGIKTFREMEALAGG